ncbi:hypothetical protein [Pectinatus frisingensis]|uniref:hypothetical protein n=1 Tax=Pectinatus frisingensis TaxID=865 RepID=UPI0018C77740|nr:hypothetical protein [Pectinatus frisingensis]
MLIALQYQSKSLIILKDEALCLICISVDACSAKLYPEEKVSERYKHFLKDHLTICHYGFPGTEASSIRIKINTPINYLKPDSNGYVDMEQIIYHVLRCGLVHNCNIDKTIELSDNTIIGDWNSDRFYVPKAIIQGLIAAIKESCF